MEIGYQIKEKISSKGGRVNYEIFIGMDNIFQLTFRSGQIWELIDQIFELWENVGIKSQKVKNSKPLICTNSKSGPEMKLLPEYMTISPWRSM